MCSTYMLCMHGATCLLYDVATVATCPELEMMSLHCCTAEYRELDGVLSASYLRSTIIRMTARLVKADPASKL